MPTSSDNDLTCHEDELNHLFPFEKFIGNVCAHWAAMCALGRWNFANLFIKCYFDGCELSWVDWCVVRMFWFGSVDGKWFAWHTLHAPSMHRINLIGAKIVVFCIRMIFRFIIIGDDLSLFLSLFALDTIEAHNLWPIQSTAKRVVVRQDRGAMPWILRHPEAHWTNSTYSTFAPQVCVNQHNAHNAIIYFIRATTSFGIKFIRSSWIECIAVHRTWIISLQKPAAGLLNPNS